VEQARSLLAQAGQKDLRVTLDTSDITSGAIDAPTLFAQQAGEGGVKVSIRRIDPAQYYLPAGGYLKRAFSFSYSGGGAYIPSLTVWYLTVMWRGAAYPETHFGSAKDDALLYDAIGELDEGKAADKWHAVQQAQFDRGGYLIYGNVDYVDGYRNNVGGLEPNRSGWNSAFQYRDAFLKT
jgi:peptide/nickel transport system substrate-binding protein